MQFLELLECQEGKIDLSKRLGLLVRPAILLLRNEENCLRGEEDCLGSKDCCLDAKDNRQGDKDDGSKSTVAGSFVFSII